MTEDVSPAQRGLLSLDRRQIALREAQDHIAGNLTPALDGRKCIDGRYASGTGQLARPGGDMGYVAVLLALNIRKQLGLTPQQWVDLVYAYATHDGGLFSLHTDTRADPLAAAGTHETGDAAIGCRHCANGADPAFAPAYGLDPHEVTTSISYAKERHRRGDRVEIVRLTGEHAEQGVIIVESEHYSINAADRAGKGTYFIYDKTRDDAYMFQLVYWLQSRNGINIALAEFQEMATRQTNATFHLQAPGMPILQVSIDAVGHASAPRFLEVIP